MTVILSRVLMHFLEQEKGLGHTPRDCSLVVCHVCLNWLTYKILFSSIILWAVKLREKTALKSVNLQVPPVIW